MDYLDIALIRCPLYDVSHVVGPYLRECIQGRGRPQNGLGLFFEPSDVDWEDDIVLHIGDMDKIDFFAPVRPRMNKFMSILITPAEGSYRVSSGAAISTLITHTPREEVVYFRTYDEIVAVEDIHTLFPNLKGLHFNRTPTRDALPELLDPGGDEEIFPFLRCILIDGMF